MPSMFVVCHQRFQCGAEQRRPGGGGGGIGGGVCRWSLRLCRGAVIKLVKCPTSGHFVLITGYNGHHHTLTWSGYTRLGPLLYSVHFPGYMTHDQTCKQCLRMFESQYFSNLCQSLLTICWNKLSPPKIFMPTHKLIPIRSHPQMILHHWTTNGNSKR